MFKRKEKEQVLSAYDENYTKKKGIKKVIRTIVETIVCIIILYFFVKNVFVLTKYKPFDEGAVEMSQNSEENGFVAISYFGVDRTGTQTLIDDDRLDEHLKALYDNGFVTISQKDVYDYYYNGKALPKYSLYLMFEDGRRDTTVFAEKITEKYNYLSTMQTYAYKFEENDPTFLTPRNIDELKKSSYWEFGTNGYRLSYINVFDRYDRFLGELTTKEYNQISPYLGRDYNHYLMDYIRDEYDMPVETRLEMKSRIDGDYEKLKEIYEDKCGEVPNFYVLMHANTGMFAENEIVSEVNRANIESIFDINFNREGYCKNNLESSEYDLTRMQPQAYWHTNHLLMRIKYDVSEDMNIEFVKGEEERFNNFNLLKGAAEYKGDELYLTCLPEDEGKVVLNKDEILSGDYLITTRLLGNAYGKQLISLGTDALGAGGICVGLANKKLVVLSGDEELYIADVDDVLNLPKTSVDEDDYAALLQERETFLQYAENTDQAYEYAQLITEQKKETPKSVEEGAKEYVPSIELKEASDHNLAIYVKDGKMTLFLDDCLAVENLDVNINPSAYLSLVSAYGGDFYSQRNLTDDVYDGVFKQFTIRDNTGAKKPDEERIRFDNCLHGMELLGDNVKLVWNKILDIFIEVF